MKNTWLFTCTFLVALLLTGCSGAEPGNGGASEASTSAADVGQAFVDDDLSAKNILQIAMASKNHTTLRRAYRRPGWRTYW